MPDTTPWPADHVERRATRSLTPSARNARQHSDHQIEQIVASIKTWGWTIPILVDDVGEIIAGHGHVLAVDRLGILQVPVMTAKGWTEAQKRAYLIADNKLTENASWDYDLLRQELEHCTSASLPFFIDLMRLLSVADGLRKTRESTSPSSPGIFGCNGVTRP